MRFELPIIFSLLVIISILSVSRAQTSQPSNIVMMEEDGSQDCTLALDSFDQQLIGYKENYIRHSSEFEILWIKIATLSQRANLRGYNTIKLDTDLEKLDLLIRKFSTNYNSFEKKLADTRKYICPKASLFKTVYKSDMDSLALVQRATTDISDFYENNIREDLLNLQMMEE